MIAADPFAPLDAALDAAPLKSGLVRRLHGGYSRAVRGVLGTVAELELVDGTSADCTWLRDVADVIARRGADRVRMEGGQ